MYQVKEINETTGTEIVLARSFTTREAAEDYAVRLSMAAPKAIRYEVIG
jgi:hypothetical protein